MQATKKQKQLIHIKLPNVEDREAVLSQFIDDAKKISCNSLSYAQANELLRQLNIRPAPKSVNWAAFNKANRQHRAILSLCRQAQWVKTHPKYGEIADLERLQRFLKSNKSPVNKPLKMMDAQELSKIIIALEGISKHRYK